MKKYFACEYIGAFIIQKRW